MTILELLLKEFDAEAVTTRKMLQQVPTDKLGWKPHEKSMTMGRLATHIAELPTWIPMTFDLDGIDLDVTSNQYLTKESAEALMAYFEASLAEGRASLAKGTADQLDLDWTLSKGGQKLNTRSKLDVLRMVQHQIIHHRAQLGVYLRLLNIPIPGSYGPSADEHF
ncbi:DinB family protein [Chitinophaga sp. Cy-1792]|uniref:DinB family protein n=1 Tax=Chitinophaga sp. Cy-1792 TaxID=2608339 RepID=UPI00141DC2DF|nr:DinB family protein [Chitinophaga sp. Cy-1792]NIG54980.1 DinB family protein [Chitinophaga sp. Cy-1792]